MEQTENRNAPPKLERQVINPHRAFIGAVLPLWLMRRTEITFGAKVCYARLAMYAGADGKCYPRQETLAAELGATRRGARKYIQELVDVGLIESVRTGFHNANEYLFLHHEWMAADGHEHDGLEQQDGHEYDGLKGVDRHECDGLRVEDRHEHDAMTVMNVPEVRDSMKRSKISGSVERDRGNGDASRVYEHYVKRVRAGARADAVRNIEKLLKVHPAEVLMVAIDAYAGNGMAEDPRYRLQANNFFGRAARYEEYLGARRAAVTEDPDPGSSMTLAQSWANSMRKP